MKEKREKKALEDKELEDDEDYEDDEDARHKKITTIFNARSDTRSQRKIQEKLNSFVKNNPMPRKNDAGSSGGKKRTKKRKTKKRKIRRKY